MSITSSRTGSTAFSPYILQSIPAVEVTEHRSISCPLFPPSLQVTFRSRLGEFLGWAAGLQYGKRSCNVDLVARPRIVLPEYTYVPTPTVISPHAAATELSSTQCNSRHLQARIPEGSGYRPSRSLVAITSRSRHKSQTTSSTPNHIPVEPSTLSPQSRPHRLGADLPH